MSITKASNLSNHLKLASELSVFALKYIDRSYCLKHFAQQYHLLLAVKNQECIAQDVLEKHILQLRKARYQARFKKGHFYQLNYVVSCIVLTVFETYSDQHCKKYSCRDFKSYLTYPVSKNTVPVGTPAQVIEDLQQGNLLNIQALEESLVDLKPQIHINEFL